MRFGIQCLMVVALSLSFAGCMKKGGSASTPDSLKEQAEKEMKAGKYDKAIKHWEALADKDPKNSETLFWLGDAYYRNKEYDKAEMTLKKSLNLNPKNVDSMFVLAHAYMDQGKYDDADAMLRKIKELHPDYPGVEEAMLELKSAKLGIPQEYEAARKAMKAKKYDEALTHWEALAKADPTNTEYFFWIADVYSRKNELGKAEQNVKQSLKLDPKNPDALYLAADVYMRMGRLDDAEAMINKLNSVYPNYPGAKKLGKDIANKKKTT